MSGAYFKPLTSIEEKLFQIAELPQLTITEEDWVKIFKHAPFPKSSIASVKRRISEALRRFVRGLELHTSRKEYHAERGEMLSALEKILEKVTSFKKIDARQHQIGVNISDKPDRVYDVAADCVSLIRAVENLKETLETMVYLSPVSTGRDNTSMHLLTRALNDIVRRHAGTNGLVRSPNDREIGTSKAGAPSKVKFNDLIFVRSVLEVGLDKAKPFLQSEKVGLGKKPDNFVLSLIKSLNDEKKSSSAIADGSKWIKQQSK